MSRENIRLTDTLDNYLSELQGNSDPIIQGLQTETAKLPYAKMQIGLDQARFMQFLLHTIHAKNTIEVGVFTGMSSLITARTLPEDGKIIACDHNQEWTKIAQKYWKQAGVDSKIDLRLGPAQETLDELIKNQTKQIRFDFAFIDADKQNYPVYYEQCLELIRPGGLILIDNALWGGEVAETENLSGNAQALKTLNEKITQDSRVTSYLAPIGDGIHLVRKN